MSQWKPIESAPKDGTRVLLWPGTTGPNHSGDKIVFLAYWWQPHNPKSPGFWVGNVGKRERPTHWMPLPDPPSTEKRSDHAFVTHSTYTGIGCAICGLAFERHEATA